MSGDGDYKLYYFDGRGRGEATRLCLTIGGVKFEDIRLDYPGYMAIAADKTKCPLETLPMLYKGDKLLACNSHAIRRHSARIAGLAPSDTDALRCEEVEFTADDVMSLYYKCVFAPTPEQNAANTEEFLTSGFAFYATYVEGILAADAATGPYIGSALTGSDVFLFCVVDYCLELVNKYQANGGAKDVDLLAAFPNLAKLMAAVRSHPKVTEFYTKK